MTREAQGDVDWTCPRHRTAIKEFARRHRDDDGNVKYGGSYFRCPSYHECGYYLSLDEGRVPLMVEGPDGELVAMGRERDR